MLYSMSQEGEMRWRQKMHRAQQAQDVSVYGGQS
jgi:hypothetical protein